MLVGESYARAAEPVRETACSWERGSVTVSAVWSRRGGCCIGRLLFDASGASGVSMVRSRPRLTFRGARVAALPPTQEQRLRVLERVHLSED